RRPPAASIQAHHGLHRPVFRTRPGRTLLARSFAHRSCGHRLSDLLVAHLASRFVSTFHKPRGPLPGAPGCEGCKSCLSFPFFTIPIEPGDLDSRRTSDAETPEIDG